VAVPRPLEAPRYAAPAAPLAVRALAAELVRSAALRGPPSRA
jgi:hypothetical protein